MRRIILSEVSVLGAKVWYAVFRIFWLYVLVYVVDFVSCQMGFSLIRPVNIYLEDIS